METATARERPKATAAATFAQVVPWRNWTTAARNSSSRRASRFFSMCLQQPTDTTRTRSRAEVFS
jgi:hypothetical protein